MDYRKTDFINFFKKYNSCKNSELEVFKEKSKGNIFNLSLRTGANFSTLEITNNSRDINIEFDSQVNYRIGIEAELILPFNKNKWGIIAEPTYYKYSAETSLDNIYQNAIVDFTFIEVPIGLRHYFYLNDNSKIFLNLVHILDFNSNSTIDFDTGIDLNLNKRNKWAAGIGYNYNSRLSIEARYQFTNDVLGDYNIWSSEFQTSSIIIGYNFL